MEHRDHVQEQSLVPSAFFKDYTKDNLVNLARLVDLALVPTSCVVPEFSQCEGN